MDEYVDEGPDRSAEARLRRLTQRVATGVPLALAAAALIWAGPFPFALLVLLFALFGVSEVYDLTELKGFRPARRTGAAATIPDRPGSLLPGRWLPGPRGAAVRGDLPGLVRVPQPPDGCRPW